MRALFQNLGVFISYASEYRPVAERIALSLRGRGYKVFLDKDDLPAGASYDDKIHQAILSSGAFIFLISPESIADGRYTLTELKFARERWPNPSRSVLPVVVAKTDLARVTALAFSTIASVAAAQVPGSPVPQKIAPTGVSGAKIANGIPNQVAATGQSVLDRTRGPADPRAQRRAADVGDRRQDPRARAGDVPVRNSAVAERRGFTSDLPRPGVRGDQERRLGGERNGHRIRVCRQALPGMELAASTDDRDRREFSPRRCGHEQRCGDRALGRCGRRSAGERAEGLPGSCAADGQA
jgi:hypothetical protein